MRIFYKKGNFQEIEKKRIFLRKKKKKRHILRKQGGDLIDEN